MDAGATQIFRPGTTEIFAPGKLAAYAGGGGGTATGWMFLTDLFHKVIPQDRPPVVLLRPQTSGLNPQMVTVALAAGGAIVLALVLTWSVSWFGNRSLVAEPRN